jgi:L-fucose dehydrogenase
VEGQELLEFAKGKALHLKKRLFSAADAQEVVQATLSTYGRIDGLVNNAGTNDGVGLEKGSPEAFLQSVEKNVGHYYFLAHYALEALKKSKGVILNISSKTAVTGQGNTSGYVAAKGAQLALTREWAVELLPYHIRVNALVPAEVYTPMYATWIQSFPNPAEKLDEIRKHISPDMRLAASGWNNEWQVLFSIILSAQTRDEKTIEVCEKLFKRFNSISQFVKARPSDLRKELKSINYYKHLND